MHANLSSVPSFNLNSFGSLSVAEIFTIKLLFVKKKMIFSCTNVCDCQVPGH